MAETEFTENFNDLCVETGGLWADCAPDAEVELEAAKRAGRRSTKRRGSRKERGAAAQSSEREPT